MTEPLEFLIFRSWVFKELFRSYFKHFCLCVLDPNTSDNTIQNGETNLIKLDCHFTMLVPDFCLYMGEASACNL